MIPPELGDTGKMTFSNLNRIKVEVKNFLSTYIIYGISLLLAVAGPVVFIIQKSEIRIFRFLNSEKTRVQSVLVRVERKL